MGWVKLGDIFSAVWITRMNFLGLEISQAFTGCSGDVDFSTPFWLKFTVGIIETGANWLQRRHQVFENGEGRERNTYVN